MPRSRTISDLVTMHFAWRLFRDREGTWQADGRSNLTGRRPTLCRGTRDEAIAMLREFDLKMAVHHQLIPAAVASHVAARELEVEDGLKKYLEDVASRKVTLDVSEITLKRYRAIFDKFLAFCGNRGVRMMLAVDRSFVLMYLTHLEKEGYKYATRYIEGTTIKQALKFLVEKGLLPESSRLRIKLRKPTESRAYCYTDADINRIFRHCRRNPELLWLYSIVVALAHAGLRISELRQLRWSNIDDERGMIRLRDDRFGGAPSNEPRQTLKGKRSRELPIAAPLRSLLKELQESDTEKDGFVFHGPNGGRVKPDTVRRALVRDVLRPLQGDSTDADGSDRIDRGRLHSFRHYFVSTCANNNVPEQMLLAWLGHQNSKLIRRYYHLHNEPARTAMNSIAWPKADG